MTEKNGQVVTMAVLPKGTAIPVGDKTLILARDFNSGRNLVGPALFENRRQMGVSQSDAILALHTEWKKAKVAA